MPREARPPRANARNALLSPQKAPVLIPLNDDREEKSVRFQSRQALHEIQMNQIRAAATPNRKRKSLGIGGSPNTPNADDQENDGSPSLNVVSGNVVTPMKRIPILANFEEWMKMATDNKINAANSWNFALIDYFHDMSLLKEGDGVNFQKASCTLDGCVKIYTSRVDSVATETGKLLSGLADSASKKSQEADGEGEDAAEGDEEEGEDGAKKRSKKRAQRSSEATLASSFVQLQLKKMELEFAVDPLFKKASADFDEGGAKGLLLNHLTVDAEGRIVFDSSDDAQEATPQQGEAPVDNTASEEGNQNQPEDVEMTDVDAMDVDLPEPSATQQSSSTADIDISSLAARFFPDLSLLDEQDICPSLKAFELGGDDDALSLPFLKAPDDWRKDQVTADAAADSQTLYGDESAPAFDDDDDMVGGGFDVLGDVGFGEGGEAWAREAAIDTRARPMNLPEHDGMDADPADTGADMMQGGEIGNFDPNSTSYGVALVKEKDVDRENILSYFDQTLQKNWAGPEHWRIRKIKDSTKPVAPTTKRKEKEPFEIDFLAPMTQALADMIYTPAVSNASISLPKSQWKSKTRNLLPDDKHFNSKQLIRLFLKPKARIGARRPTSKHSQQQYGSAAAASQDDVVDMGEMDEAYWARQQNAAAISASQDLEEQQPAAQGQYDANFFQDDGLGMPPPMMDDDDDEHFADAQEGFALGSETGGVGGGEGIPSQQLIDGMIIDSQDSANGAVPMSSQAEGFGTQLVTQSRRLRPEYVQYARVAKKVDIRRLKDEMWRGLGVLETQQPPPLQSEPSKENHTTKEDEEPTPGGTDVDAKPTPTNMDFANNNNKTSSTTFTTLLSSLKHVYPPQSLADISTSFCFISLLHLANEKGLVLTGAETMMEIGITRDWSANGGGGGE